MQFSTQNHSTSLSFLPRARPRVRPRLRPPPHPRAQGAHAGTRPSALCARVNPRTHTPPRHAHAHTQTRPRTRTHTHPGIMHTRTPPRTHPRRTQGPRAPARPRPHRHAPQRARPRNGTMSQKITTKTGTKPKKQPKQAKSTQIRPQNTPTHLVPTPPAWHTHSLSPPHLPLIRSGLSLLR